ncbi:TetR/AcrR family transcriptional regulator [Actinomyces sp. oral taxon 448]|uniref:TetR/AcrR family transcriptional regulator n=1 Tax=Actinomyces sp. oral taxon 448 TaxID=712124 RepID=UPI000A02FAFD|nr:TetR family transcriptional regulator [Actinomyces sp. oral taxon 448]
MPPRSDRRPRLRMDPDERRRLILDVARREFAARPYEEVSLSAIARAARASEALVHKYFSTKGRLYGQILSLDAADLAERTRLAAETLTDDATVRDHVRTSVGVYLDFIAERAPGWAEYQMLAGYEPSEAAEVRRRAREASVEALRRLLARTGGADRATGPDGSGGRDGAGGADDSRTSFALWGYLGFLETVCLQWVSQGCPASARPALTDAAVGCLEGALGAEASAHGSGGPGRRGVATGSANAGPQPLTAASASS